MLHLLAICLWKKNDGVKNGIVKLGVVKLVVVGKTKKVAPW